MSWDGKERRNNQRFCESHIQMANDVAVTKSTLINLDKRINGSLLAIEKHINEGKGWRTTIAGLAVAVGIQILSFAYLYGNLSKQVQVNTIKLDKIEILQKGVANDRNVKINS